MSIGVVCLASKRQRSLVDIRRLCPRDFELLIADIWQECQGWDTEVTNRGADMGIDIYGRPPGGGALTAVQAKRYAAGRKVSAGGVQRSAALRQQFREIEGVTFVTTSSFTNPALEAARNLDVKCIDGDDLLRLIDRYHAQEIVDWYCSGKPTGGGYR